MNVKSTIQSSAWTQVGNAKFFIDTPSNACNINVHLLTATPYFTLISGYEQHKFFGNRPFADFMCSIWEKKIHQRYIGFFIFNLNLADLPTLWKLVLNN